MAVLPEYTVPFRGIWKIEERADELLLQLSDSPIDRRALDALHTEKRRQEWLASRLLLRTLRGRDTPIAYHPNGAPYLPEESLFISLSHTTGYVAVLLQPSPFAGIDIELKTDRVARVRTKFMAESEEGGLDTVHERDHLLIHWCAKETLFKMIGQPDVDFRRHLHVMPFPYAEAGTFIVRESRTPRMRAFEMGYQVTPDFVWVWSTGCLFA